MHISNSFDNLKKTTIGSAEEKEELIKNQSRVLWNYYTKFTDYIANIKIPIKDIAVYREYLKPLKWDKMTNYKSKLGNSA